MPAIKLIVGLGNPGSEYAQTRHNAGQWFVENLAQRENIELRPEKKFNGQLGRIKANSHECWLFTPACYMNESGHPIRSIANFYKIKTEEILVAHDELDFSAGTIRLKQGGGHGGHNGLRDMTSHLGNNFYRLRIGIGHPGDKNRVHDYVLGRPSKSDLQNIEKAIENGLLVIDDVIPGKIDAAMKKLHTD